MKKLLALCCALPVMAGCDTWPEYGRGGLAEMRPPDAASDKAAGQEYLDLMRAMLRLEELKRGGALDKIPGHVANAELMTVEIRRELAGDLIPDARIRLIRLGVALDSMEGLLRAPIAPET